MLSTAVGQFKGEGLVEPVAIFGLGAMGEGIATRLRHAGHPVNITLNRTRASVARLADHGATLHSSKYTAVEASDAVILCLPNADVSSAVINEIWPALDVRHLVIDTGTSSVAASIQLAKRLGERNLSFVESPVAGGKAQAAAGQLGAFVGCSEADFGRAESLLRHFCSAVQHFGPVGYGSSAKLISNYLVLSMVRLIIETFHAADVLDIEWGKFFEIIRRGSANSGALQRMIGSIVEDDNYDGYVFSVENAAKDLSYIAELGSECELPVLSDAALRLFGEANELGLGEQMVSALLRQEIRQQITELTVPR